MNVPKKFMSALLAGFMLMQAAGCGTGNSESGSSSAAEPAGTAAANQNDTPEPAVTTEAYDTDWSPADASLGYQTLDLGRTTEDMVRRSVLNTGNRARLADVMKRAQNGEGITFGVIGGSITQGTGASGAQDKYAERALAWWIRSFPDAAAKIQYVNAGIGATDSYIGVHRAARDLLSKDPSPSANSHLPPPPGTEKLN